MSSMFNIFKKFNELDTRITKIERFGNLFFVDTTNGHDTQFSGLRPNQAKKTINAAVALCEDYNHDVIIFKSKLWSPQFTEQQVIDVKSVHLFGHGYMYGMGGGWGSCFNTPATCDSILEGDIHDFKCGLVLAKDDIEVAGLKFINPNATQAQWHLGLLDNLGDARNCAIHDCIFQGDQSGTPDRTSGIRSVGVESGLIFRNEFYCCEQAVRLESGSKRFSTKNIIRDLKIQGSAYGLTLREISCMENFCDHIDILPKQYYGYAMTAGMYVYQAPGNMFHDIFVGHATVATAYRTNINTNYWPRCWYVDANGKAVEYDGVATF